MTLTFTLRFLSIFCDVAINVNGSFLISRLLVLRCRLNLTTCILIMKEGGGERGVARAELSSVSIALFIKFSTCAWTGKTAKIILLVNM